MSNNTGCNNNAECFQTSNVAASRPRGADIILIDVMDAYGSFTPVAMCSGVCERAGEPLVSEPTCPEFYQAGVMRQQPRLGIISPSFMVESCCADYSCV